MASRALGKALGRRWRPALDGRGPRASTLAVALWVVGAGIAGQPELRAETLPAFDEADQVAAKKQRFFDFLGPVVRAENDRISRQRTGLLDIASARAAGERLSWRQAWFLGDLAREYRLDGRHLTPGELIGKLLERVDVIPASLVLAQAAKESGWGSSRFARRANNLFGQWCFEPGCGLVPRQRPAGMVHEVRSFATVRHSVVSYMRNLNTHPSYRRLRALRAELRERARPLSGMLLAEGLTRYSERGLAYVREVQVMIRQNALETRELGTAVTGS
jgi:Bax protein